ncbi:MULTISPECIES: ferredoxin--NADP reductase [unclassified Haematospirillum]|uniref:ferredoxin--NADP reductase n=1 Tax=unclassified Haematospirillum TaxID=2622088 RepID=UPI00143C6879|nr:MULTISPECIES: ferredoxin--NADP reductase [unclassified Haematospirillum]NKD55787.1 ferredoxin--NADP reductase [Haematospirillum sp. H4890]NKD75902.1 ferredoxin--NADP reductase [Haematospirillum sp. H4485]
MSNIRRETVTYVHHWTDRLFSFRTTRDPGFRYINGQFTMIGLQVEGKPLLRAYSMVSANYEDELEFLSIKVPDGPLTSRLQHIRVGDMVLVGTKPVGTLVQDSLLPGRHLYLLSTGTGLAPFMSVIRDPDAYERYEKIILVHGCREVAEFAYADYITRELPKHEFLGDLVRDKLLYYTTVTREQHPVQGRITTLIESGKMFSDLGLPEPNVEDDRFMLCGSPAMLTDTTKLLEGRGFHEGASNDPRQYVIEKAFVEK